MAKLQTNQYIAFTLLHANVNTKASKARRTPIVGRLNFRTSVHV